MSAPLAFQAALPLSPSRATLPSLRSRNAPVCVAEPPPRPLPNLVEHGFRNIPESRPPLSVSFSRPCPTFLASRTFYRMTSAIFETLHADGMPWRAEHWFDAIGAVHAFKFDPAARSVTYRSRLDGADMLQAIRNQAYADFRPTQAIMPKPANRLHQLRKLFTDVHRDPETGMPLANACVSLEHIPGFGLSARTDFNLAQCIDPETLEPLFKFTFSDVHPKLSGLTASSHGVYDRDAGEYINYVVPYLTSKPGSVEYTLFKIGSDGNGGLITSFREPLYLIHSFAVTENYIVMVMWPAGMNVSRIFFTKELQSSVEFHKHRPTKFIVVSRAENKVVAKYEHDAFFCFHVINAFEQDDSVVIDLSKYPDTACIEKQTIGAIASGGGVADVRPTRFTLPDLSRAKADGPTRAHQAHSRQLADIFFENPQTAPAALRRPYRYAYGVSDGAGGEFYKDIAKLDVQTGAVRKWGRNGCFVGESIFVPDPKGRSEDDGCLLVPELDGNRQVSSLVVLDAKSMREVTRAKLPFIVPHGFHSFFQ